MKNNKFTILMLFLTLGSTVMVAASALGRLKANAGNESEIETASQDDVIEPDVSLDDNVRRRSLLNRLQVPFDTLGDRLEKRSKERISLSGTVVRAGAEQPTQFASVWERPGRLRFEESGSRQQLVVFDGQTVSRSSPVQASDDALLETLHYDSSEHFFVSQMQGSATRFLGERFRLIEDSETEHTGPFYDVFEVTEQVLVGSEGREQSRQYFFNSDTHLLDLVRHELLREGATVRVEVRLEDWQQVNGQRFPSRIVRLENDVPIFTLALNLDSITVSAKADDGLFKP